MYLALYRKYRPRTFDDVISQEPITTTLKNQIKNGSAGHAYLFTGSRGTGKTTCAKILAMAVNCLNPIDGSPCLECERCREILDGSATDIVEMDAASNNGVDDVRQLRDEVNYTPVSCKFRVYIIDEVHMLSGPAFNALLKTLEEPPEHVKFILATTELQKVPATIVSRCQRFEFRRIDPADSSKRLFYVAENEGITLESDAAALISHLSDGGMRDALSILDRCACADRHVTADVVRKCAGVADTSHLTAFAKMISEKDAAGCIRLLSELYKSSKDPALVIGELSERFRDMMICKTAPNDTDLLSALPGEHDAVRETAEAFSLGEILRCLNLMRQCSDNIGKTRGRRILAEMCFVKMCLGMSADEDGASGKVSVKPEMRVKQLPREEFVPTPPEKMSRESLRNLNKMRALGEETARLVSGEPPLPEPPPEISREIPPEAFSETPPESEIPVKPASEAQTAPENKAENSDAAAVPEKITDEEWRNVVARADGAYRFMLEGSRAEICENALVIHTSSALLINNAKGDELIALENVISDALGRKVAVRLEKETVGAEKAADGNEIERLFERARRLGVEIKQE